MPLTISKLHNANVYLDGTNDLIGRAAQVTLPTLTTQDEEHVGLGMVGPVMLPAGLQEIELQIEWTGFYADHLIAAADPFTSHNLQFRGSHETFTNQGRAEQLAYVVQFTGRWKETSLGTLRARQSANGYDDTLTGSYLKVRLDQRDLIEVDLMNNKWIVDGRDLLADYRANIGQ